MNTFILLTTLLCTLAVHGRSQATEGSSTFCENTASGRWRIADNSGRVCSRTELDHSTGCCPRSIEPYTCETCSVVDECCASYENCVSCCMYPKNEAMKRMADTFIGLNKPETGRWQNSFDFCSGQCRTTSRSTENENAYIGKRHFCFSNSLRPRDDAPVDFDSSDVFVQVGKTGESCQDACNSQDSVCLKEEMLRVNKCDEMRAAFMCEAGCGSFEDDRATDSLPGYMSSKAPKEDYPARCIIREPEESSEFSCDAADKQISRLCVCARRNTEVEADNSISIQENNSQGAQTHDSVQTVQRDIPERQLRFRKN